MTDPIRSIEENVSNINTDDELEEIHEALDELRLTGEYEHIDNQLPRDMSFMELLREGDVILERVETGPASLFRSGSTKIEFDMSFRVTYRYER